MKITAVVCNNSNANKYTKKTNIVEEYFLLIPADDWKSFFKREFDDRIRELLANVSHERSYDAIWKEKTRQLSKDYGESVIKLRAKRDHKKQKRMQCAILYNDFLELYKKYGVDNLL